MATSLDKLENKVQIHHLHKMLSFGEKIAKIDPVHPEIIILRKIIKKRKKITEGKIYTCSPVSNLAERSK